MASSDHRDDTSSHHHSVVAESLRAQLAEKDAELKAIREELKKTASHVVGSSHALPSQLQLGGLDGGDDKESLRKQLNEATARWRWEERRAKAREEELEQTAKSERARADAIAKDLEELRVELTQTKDKVREATRKRAQMQAEQTAMKTELDALKAKSQETETALNFSEERVKETTWALHDVQNQLKSAEATIEGLRAENKILAEERDVLRTAANERDDALEKVAKMEVQLAASEERALSLKQTMRHNAQLVKDLKAELARSMVPPAVPPPPQAPTTPPVARQTAPATPNGEDQVLLKELASRLENLLKENGTLHERIKFLEDIVQGLTADLNRATGKTPTATPSPNARPPSVRLRPQQ